MVKVNWIDYDARFINEPDEISVLKHIELCGRVCYNSYNRITNTSYDSFVRGLITSNHLSVLEHVQITVEVTMDRGLSHEWVRHRVGSAYSQQSTRYCRFNDTINCILPVSLRNDTTPSNVSMRKLFMSSAERACENYGLLLDGKVAPQIARGILPTCVATVLIATHNLREWRHIFKERYFNRAAHPDMIYVMGKVFDMMNIKYPTIFNDMVTNTPIVIN